MNTPIHVSSRWCWFCADGPTEFSVGIVGSLRSYEICGVCAKAMEDPLHMIAIIHKAESEQNIG